MTPDEAQMDILLRRYARRPEGDSATGHLDADELSAFAEDALPAESRLRYVSHLADCSDCRQLASQLTIASGVAPRAATAVGSQTDSWREKLAAFFRPPTLRYAAFALVLIAATATVFIVMRRPNPGQFTAQTESAKHQTSVDVPQSASGYSDSNSAPSSRATPSASQIAPKGNLDQKPGEVTTSAPSAAPAKAGEEIVASKTGPPVVKEDVTRPATATVPSYAPPPPGEAERQKALSREQDDLKNTGGLAGMRKAEADKPKAATEQPRNFEYGKDRRAGPYDNTNQRSQQAVNQNTMSDAASGNEARGAGRTRNAEATPSNKAAASADRDDAEKKQAETRSAGGHKFRRQGNVWVDTKYKSSMPVADVTRDSDEYRALGSSLKAAVEQLGSGVIVVSKGKAYRIR
jgi:hypothetical protein